MTESVLLVDLENIQNVDLTLIPPDARVLIFYGITQKKLPVELVVQAQPLGARLTWIKISGSGPNALDFHIAFYLGQEFALRKAACVVLSKDTGFDPLVRHLTSLGHQCRRVTTLQDVFPARASGPEHDAFARLIALLRKEKSRPAKLRGLRGKVRSWFPKLSEAEREMLLGRLFSESGVRESGASLVYAFDD